MIILNRDGGYLLDAVLDSVSAWPESHDVEVVLVDQASRDDSVEVAERWAAQLPIRLVRAERNYSFAYANNRAAEIASGDYLLFLNNDTVVQEGNLEHLLEIMRDSEVGIVGIRLHDPSCSGPDAMLAGEAIQHIGIRFGAWDVGQGLIPPYNVQPLQSDVLLAQEPTVFPAVTGVMLLCRRDEFLRIGGFSEDYVFGYEDVDLCLKIRAELGKEVVSANQTYVFHHNAWSRRRLSPETMRLARRHNARVLWRRFGYFVKRDTARRLPGDDGGWTGRRLAAAFAVTEVGGWTAAGDTHTALELGESLSRRLGWDVRFLPPDSWHDVHDADIVVAMTDHFDASKVLSSNPGLIKIAWVRNRADRWEERTWFADFDLYLAASEVVRDYLVRSAGVQAHVFRLATNTRRFTTVGREESARYDYVFTGNHSRAPREILDNLRPDELRLRGAVFGAGWEREPRMQAIWRGFVPYEQLPSVYRSTRIVVDDANHVTKPWGSVNSSVFDALASGALVVTNGALGAEEVFGDAFPTYDGPEDLNRLLTRFTRDDAARQRLVREFREIVTRRHTYDVRAHELFAILEKHLDCAYRISIKAPASGADSAVDQLIDSVRAVFKSLGHSVRVDLPYAWETREGLADDVVLVFRGTRRYEPREGQINLLVSLGEGRAIPNDECELYDHVFVPRASLAEQLQARLSVSVTAFRRQHSSASRGEETPASRASRDLAEAVLKVADGIHAVLMRGPGDRKLQDLQGSGFPDRPDARAEDNGFLLDLAELARSGVATVRPAPRGRAVSKAARRSGPPAKRP